MYDRTMRELAEYWSTPSRGGLPPRIEYRPNSPPTSDYERDDQESELMIASLQAMRDEGRDLNAAAAAHALVLGHNPHPRLVGNNEEPRSRGPNWDRTARRRRKDVHLVIDNAE
jgi:hypothetical protein